jgi:hypothetical protein
VGVWQQCRPAKPMGGRRLPTVRLTSGPHAFKFLNEYKQIQNAFKFDLMKKWASRAQKISNKIPGNCIWSEELLLSTLSLKCHAFWIKPKIPFPFEIPRSWSLREFMTPNINPSEVKLEQGALHGDVWNLLSNPVDRRNLILKVDEVMEFQRRLSVKLNWKIFLVWNSVLDWPCFDPWNKYFLTSLIFEDLHNCIISHKEEIIFCGSNKLSIISDFVSWSTIHRSLKIQTF